MLIDGRRGCAGRAKVRRGSRRDEVRRGGPGDGSSSRRAAATGLLLAATVVSLALPASAAFGQDDEVADGVARPDRLTAGDGDQFLGQLSPDGQTLYYVGNLATMNEIYAEDVEDGRSARLFDEDADVDAPRISPDGRRLAYLSYRDTATGQLCVRDLPAGGDRRCLPGSFSALQAAWIDPTRLLLLSRESIEGNLALLDVTVGSRLSARPRFSRNLTSPAISPGGRWLVFVPVARDTASVGPAFAAHAAPHLEALRLDRGGDAVSIALDLPGVSGEPSFSLDGRWLYFVQFMTDSNHDGTTDASDHGVLFRVPFPADRDDAPAIASATAPQQLTDGSWDCRYPALTAGKLTATCSHGAGLAVYDLPPGGEIPEDWDAARVREEIDLADGRAEQLLLYRHLLSLTRDVEARRLLLVRLARLHLNEGDFDAAAFYARRLETLPDPRSKGLSRPLLALVAQRRARREMERGRAIADFVPQARRRFQDLAPGAGDSPAAVTLSHVVRAEISLSLGDFGAARRELEAAGVDEGTPRSVIELYAEGADALYRALDDRANLTRVCLRLAADMGLPADARLDYARAAVHALVRGRSWDAAAATLVREQSLAPPGSELSFALALGRTVLAIRDADPPPEATAALLALYRSAAGPDRRRAVVLEGLARAEEVGADPVIEAVATRYLNDVPAGTTERRRAVRLFRRALVGRAFRRLAEGKPGAARADFDRVFERTGSLESLVESLDLRLRAGESPAALAAEWRHRPDSPPAALVAFARAYLLARALPGLPDAEHARAKQQALSLLRSEWATLHGARAAQALYGSILIDVFRRSHDVRDAERADTHLLVALELSEKNPRYQAMVESQLGLLHTTVGNYRIALAHLDDREKLPYPDGAASLAAHLARARDLFHIGHDADAAETADRALAEVDASPALAGFRVLALDRAGLYHLAAGRFARALSLYDAELPLLPSGGGRAGRNRVGALLGHAAAALGAGKPERTLADIAEVKRALADPAIAAALGGTRTKPAAALRRDRRAVLGLEANADLALGRFGDATRVLEELRGQWLERLRASGHDEDLEALALVDARLAAGAGRRGDLAAAARWSGDALARADDLERRTGTPLGPAQLDALWLGAELATLEGVPVPFDVPIRLRAALATLASRQDPAFRRWQRWFEIALVLTSPAPVERAARP